ncbi:gluconate 2-dehydrogenase subunit 3 family protein [Parapedobacter koreensis]|uniref:Gluconate 2-dehydrogenase subunit 3 n=1 Tax=Parapedobacter koreensis TaxID=332977 RepID=A0A1H7IIF6_9SPHI|nr:gluconate 2-dehydrogenase subunit 3 family protein [Parapedobacter koreensis]SEK62094.1 Gluconate 2-dehydrogenase subunit 3 [Parapedobacter koreensis]
MTIGLATVSSFSIFQWIRTRQKVNLAALHLKRETIAILADTIIPKTESPGAAEANVADFVVNMVDACFDTSRQRRFLAGLAEVDDYCRATYHQAFIECGMTDRVSVLNHLEAKATYRMPLIGELNRLFFGEPFIVTLKSLVVEGYCTSELGATMGLAYDYIPVHYQSCIAMGESQRVWATN